ncbi:MAG: hypothetical protein A3F90_16700 [Deltaproteobacteria bacterium RIFCSPLOWO2_12_FULL_60_19]|nr:MAG: hypothetical protein A3F90_16700 [Deltaproteobacteria bacterium RIFCSPLOWO2_12_FULL_60_19]
MRHPRTNTLLLVFAASFFLNLTDATAQLGLNVSGNLGSGFSYSKQIEGEVANWSMARTNSYNLGLQGNILDARLATFNIAGALSTSDLSSNQQSAAVDSRLLSLLTNVTLLPGKPYPLDLRFSKSRLTSASNTDVLSFGGSWRVVYQEWPSVFLNFDRVNIQNTGQTEADTTFTTGTLRLAKRIFDSDVDAEFGVQHFSDNVQGTSILRHFGRFSDTTPWSPATTLRLIGDYFMQEGSRSMGANFSLLNRPDPTLTRSLGLGVRNTSIDGQEQTTLDANGSLSKAYQPYPTLSIRPFAATFVSRRFDSGEMGNSPLANGSSGTSTGNSLLANGSLGTSVVSTYFPSLIASVDYGAGVSYTKEGSEETNIGMTQQVHAGLESTFLKPVRLRGDYMFTLERTLTERNRHQASLRADAPVTPSLILRSNADFFREDATFSDREATISSKQTTIAIGSGLSYTGIPQLYLDLGANAVRTQTDISSSWLMRVTANVNYRPRDRLTIQLSGLWETDTLNQLTRYELTTRALYQFGQSTVNFEYRFESHKSFDQPGQAHAVMITINRPFRFRF